MGVMNRQALDQVVEPTYSDCSHISILSGQLLLS